jgi:acyl-CoA thioesterase II
MASTVEEQLSVEEIGKDEFVSKFNPGRMGNMNNIAYGGCTIGVGIEAATQTVSGSYFLYSAMGNYLGPALTDRKLKCFVRRVRDTRTFATRIVEIGQEQDDGKLRLCMTMLADFQIKEKASLLEYSAPPERSYSSVEKCQTALENIDDFVKKGVVPEMIAEIYKTQFDLMGRFFEVRTTPEGVVTHNLNGLAKTAKTPQDDMALTSKTSADWFRCRHPLQDKYAALSFLLDGSLSFLPLAHNNMFLDDAAACSSLDFSLRFFTTDVDPTQWHMREMKTIAAGNGRTFSESRLWDQKGNMVADMSQQSILRPLPGEKSKL